MSHDTKLCTFYTNISYRDITKLLFDNGFFPLRLLYPYPIPISTAAQREMADELGGGKNSTIGFGQLSTTWGWVE